MKNTQIEIAYRMAKIEAIKIETKERINAESKGDTFCGSDAAENILALAEEIIALKGKNEPGEDIRQIALTGAEIVDLCQSVFDGLDLPSSIYGDNRISRRYVIYEKGPRSKYFNLPDYEDEFYRVVYSEEGVVDFTPLGDRVIED